MDSVNKPDSGVVLQAAASLRSTAGDHWTTTSRPDGVDRATVGPTSAGTSRRKREPLLGLIVSALREAGSRGLILASIYRYVIDHCPDYSDLDSSGRTSAAWRKNVRHILSVRNFFVKTAELNPAGRGRFWRLDEVKYAEFIADRSEATETRDRRQVSSSIIAILYNNNSIAIDDDRLINCKFIARNVVILR